MTVLSLESALWKLDIAPQMGASVFGLQAKLSPEHAWQAIMRPTPASVLDNNGVSSLYSSFTLAPYSNRIRNAQFNFRGESFQLRATTPQGHCQHGDFRNRPWQVLEHNNHTLICQLDSRTISDFNFPFACRITAQYSLTGDQGQYFDTTLTLENLDSRPMPAGFGLHPYFITQVLGSHEARLQFQATGVYLPPADLIPTEAASTIPPALDFSQERSLSGVAVDHAFAGWDGLATLRWAGSGHAMRMTADAVFGHLVVYAAPDGSIAIEPVSHCTDGFNLAEQGVIGTGTQVLAAGEQLQGTVRLCLISETEL